MDVESGTELARRPGTAQRHALSLQFSPRLRRSPLPPLLLWHHLPIRSQRLSFSSSSLDRIMAKGSQLTQLKTALSSAGLSRQSQPGSSKSKAKDGGPGPSNKRKRGPDDEKKLDRIRKAMNPFEEKVTRVRPAFSC